MVWSRLISLEKEVFLDHHTFCLLYGSRQAIVRSFILQLYQQWYFPLMKRAAIVGATRFQRVIHVDLPCIAPTIIITLILNAGNILSLGFEKAYLMQNALNYNTSEIIATYVYKTGIEQAQFSFSTAVGLFNAVINAIILLIVNKMADKISGTSLF